jgi:integrase
MRGHIRKKGPSWQACVKTTDPVTGRSRQLTATRRTKGEAEIALMRLLAQAGRTDASASSATITELLAAWQEVHASRWSPSTLRNTREFAERYIVPRFGRVLVRKLRTADLDIWYADLVRGGGKDGRPLAASSVQRIHNVMRSALGQAVKWEWIADNPASRVTLPRGERHEIASPAPSDVVRLVDAAMANDADFGTWLQLAAATGARRGELCALRWRDFDLDAGTVHIARSIAIGDTIVEKDTKTGNRRRITLDPGTVELVRAHRRRVAARALQVGVALDPAGYAFSLEVDGSKPWRPDLPTKRFGRLRDGLGLEHVRLHDLRHFVATTLLGGGVDLATVAGRLGHAGGGRTTLAVYAHMLEHADRAASDLIADTLRKKSS